MKDDTVLEPTEVPELETWELDEILEVKDVEVPDQSD